MAENSKIEWTDHTFNPWIGCTKVSAACDHCYAETWDTRFNGERWGPHAARTRTSAANWRKPLAWDKQAAAERVRRRVFCASLADVFDNHKSIDPEWRADLWELIQETQNLDWLLLTKRPQNVKRFLPDEWDGGEWGGPWPNVWLGTTVENQEEADRRISHLLSVPAVVHFVSCEPLLGSVDLTRWLSGCHECAEECGFRSSETAPPRNERCHTCGWVGQDAGEFCPDCGAQDFGGVCPDCNANVVQHHPDTTCLDWVICGGESGPDARPMHPDWARSLRDQCRDAGVAFHFKQWGEHDHDGRRIGKKETGRLLDGIEWNGLVRWRDDLRQ